MVSRENWITIAFVVVALPAAYAVNILLESNGIAQDTAFTISFFVLLVVGVGLPKFATHSG
ncbi:hypothetical protein SAMN05421858_4814 [Haladaptatus litoreus]|uniref:Uncharacterized protein n=1 Tax=Haladaptatus litoreus TaxID=553468 RepID=A0A1N7F8F1_9EURY|nr:hypothetical protein SAMN05421858_4814 [Haladaptatus litoreus]